MSDAGERASQVPDGAKAVTAKDVITQPAPERVESVEYWMFKAPNGLTEVVRIRPEIGERGAFHTSPLDGSKLGVVFEFHGGEKNEMTGERYVPVASCFFIDRAFAQEPVYKEGESPAEMELKRRVREREEAIQVRAAKMAEGLDDLLDDKD